MTDTELTDAQREFLRKKCDDWKVAIGMLEDLRATATKVLDGEIPPEEYEQRVDEFDRNLHALLYE